MKILYGIQGTGNGHITRARAMAAELAKAGVDVDYLFSGRPRDRFFDMEAFGNFQHRDGLTFATRHGRIHALDTLLGAKPLTLLKDIKSLQLKDYDLILSDYEPVTAWAAKLRKAPLVALGHQYAFRYPIPQHRGSPGQRWLMQYFAPADTFLGLHWHHFNQPILPPIAPVGSHGVSIERRHILVYLPFESVTAIIPLFDHFPEYSFSLYHPEAEAGSRFGNTRANMRWHIPARDSFQADLHRCEGVICNAGFELASEALQLGKKLLVKPVDGQPEQYSNALALDLLGYGHSMPDLNREKVAQWLTNGCGTRIVYPNVAAAICAWITAGASGSISDLATSLWEQAILPDITPATRTDSNLPATAAGNFDDARKSAHG